MMSVLRVVARVEALQKKAAEFPTLGDVIKTNNIPYDTRGEPRQHVLLPDVGRPVSEAIASQIKDAVRTENFRRERAGQPLAYYPRNGQSVLNTKGVEMPTLGQTSGVLAAVGGIPLALVGGVGGAAIGALSSLLAQKKGKRTPGRNALIGGAIGAGMGGMAGAGLGAGLGVAAHMETKNNPVDIPTFKESK